MKRFTITDISRLSGFSEKTVSRVINNEKAVKEETKHKILKVIKQYNYRPNILARGLASNRTYTIGLVVANISNPCISKIIETLEQEASKRNYNLLLRIYDNVKEKEQIYNLLDNMVDGIIFVAVIISNYRELEYLKEKNIPFLLMLERMFHFDTNFVGVDNEYGSKVMMSHLYESGCRVIGFIKGRPHASGSMERYNGYKKFLKEKSLPFIKDLIAEGNSKYEGGYRAFNKIIKSQKAVQAIFCANDYMALGAIDAARKLGFSVPENIRIVGWDDIPFASHSNIKLTTVRLPYKNLAKHAIRIVLEEISGKNIGVNSEVILKPVPLIRN